MDNLVNLVERYLETRYHTPAEKLYPELYERLNSELTKFNL